jgi:uncharacterized protein
LIFYLDTSFSVTAFTPEAATTQAQNWFERHRDSQINISDWVLTEFSSALSMKIRTGDLTIEQRNVVQASWDRFAESSLGLIAVQREDFTVAKDMAERHDLSLRASDALHLAIARRAGCTLVTLDKRLAEAAPHVGVLVANLTPD